LRQTPNIQSRGRASSQFRKMVASGIMGLNSTIDGRLRPSAVLSVTLRLFLM